MKLKNILFLFLLTIGMISCDKDSDKPTPTPSRTVLVYMVASDLGSYLQTNIDHMIAVATNKNLNGGNLLVYYSWVGSDKTLQGTLYQIKEGNGGIVTKHNLKEYTGQSAIDPQFMRSLIQGVFTDYPADSYGLILSSHGTSWLPTNHSSLRSFGEENKKKMEIYDLAAALQGLPLEFLAIDACSMGGIECVYELKDVAQHIISSPSEIMGTGFPYKVMLPYFFTTAPDYTNMIKGFYDYYTTYANPYGNLSVVKTDQLDGLAQVTKEIIASAGMEGMYALPLNQLQVLSYLPGSTTKLYDFEDMMNRMATEAQKTKFKEILDKTVISKASTSEIYCSGDRRAYTVSTHSGLSVYPLQERLPELNEWYKTNLSWYTTVFP